MTARVANVSEEKLSPEERREAALVAAADQGARAFYKVAGFTRLFMILGAAAVTAFLIDRRGKTLFPRFVQQLVNGASPADAFRDVYSSDPRALADDFLQQAAKAARGDNN